ncbi:UDP-N-acetylglucosamine 2-epimerase [Chitinophaga deserti]|uniref:UDP-N-acetylglucosamine 2-epimerase n=1 Tax=Chitinophaga deserti TaxID=2164099 RepID=UPI000D6A9BEE|nr:UDP-N-acetylglucosamine 2-epimerase [Chitinophaga deserti]
MSVRKICVITGTRAEYGLLYWTMKALEKAPEIELQVLATGMHLSPEFGMTYRQIEQDGFRINKKVEMLVSADTPAGIAKSMGLGMIGYADALAELQPDIVLVLGDRFEIFSAASAAMIHRIPIAHCHGGEATEGLIDEPIRHSITKMSHIHFTATDIFRNRVIQLGEQPEHVYNVGGLGIENINKLSLLNKKAFEESIDFQLGKKNLLITFHPVTFEKSSAEIQFKSLLQALDEREDTNLIFTKANADTDGRIINQLIDEFVLANKHKAIAFTSLGQLRYLSSLQHVDAVVGNSSSGLVEVPSFKIPTINIGDRQRGRPTAESVISCGPDYSSIKLALEMAYSENFRKKLPDIHNPYGTGNSSDRIVEVLRNVKIEDLIKKKFYDLQFNIQ